MQLNHCLMVELTASYYIYYEYNETVKSFNESRTLTLQFITTKCNVLISFEVDAFYLSQH